MNRRVHVGMCLTSEGAVLAVLDVDGRGCTVTGVAGMTWPAGLWSVPGPERDGPERDAATATTARLLRTARHRLGVPRWGEVIVTRVPDVADDRVGIDDIDDIEVTARVAGLLARAGLTLAGALTVEQADARRGERTVHVPPELAGHVDRREGALAIAAALGFVSGDNPAGDAEVGVAEIDAAEIDAAEGGWVVEYVGELSSPS